MSTCFCVGPQRGERLCPCQLRDVYGPGCQGVPDSIDWDSLNRQIERLCRPVLPNEERTWPNL